MAEVQRCRRVEVQRFRGAVVQMFRGSEAQVMNIKALTNVRTDNFFLALWVQMPRYRWLTWIVGLPGVFQIACRIYDHVLAPAIYHWHLRRADQAEGRWDCGVTVAHAL